MKLRDRVLVGFCLSLVVVTVLFVVDLQNESARRMADVESDGGGGGFGLLHGRSRESAAESRPQSVWDVASSLVRTTLKPSRPAPGDEPPARDQAARGPPRPGAPQPYASRPGADRPVPPADPYADDRFDDLTERLTRPDFAPSRGNVADWAAVRDVIVDDTYDGGTVSNEYVVEYLEHGLR